jgi:pimeloyl-ACP methyl ester carboxylesterase
VPEATVHGLTLHYDVFGQPDADPILLICGTGQRSFTWQLFQVPALNAAGYRVVTFENRGIPPSDCPPAPYSVKEMAEDAAGLIEELGLAPCRVAGLSLGAMITQELALAHPELVRCAVPMGTIGRQSTFGKYLTQAWVEESEAGVERNRIAEAVDGAFAVFSAHAIADDDRMQQYFDFALQMPRWENPGRLGQHMADRTYDDRLGDLAGIRVPCMVMAFELDMLTTAPLCKEVADAIPGCEYVEIPACGHAGPLEKPDEVNVELLRFFAST